MSRGHGLSGEKSSQSMKAAWTGSEGDEEHSRRQCDNVRMQKSIMEKVIQMMVTPFYHQSTCHATEVKHDSQWRIRISQD